MDKNKFRCLLIDEYNHSRIFISEKNRYYIRRDNKSIHIQILNEFKDIRKSYGINVNDTTDNYYKIDDTTDNNYFYEIDEPYIIKHCTILLIDKDAHTKMFFPEKKSYYICNDFHNDYDVDGYDYFGDACGDYDYYYCGDYDDNYGYYNCDDYYYYYYDNDYDGLVYYKMPLNYFERLVSVKNNIVNSSNNNGYNQTITLIINNCRIYIS